MSEERAQVLPLAVILVVVLALLTVPVLSAGWLMGTRSASQRAADAAALAGAGQAVVARQVDARGDAYCASIAVDPVRGPAAAARYWALNAAGMQTRSFSAVPQGATLTVRASVAARAPLWTGERVVTWDVVAIAKVVQPAGAPACLSPEE